MNKYTLLFVSACLCGSIGCSVKRESTVVEREPARVVVQHQAVPDTTITRERVTTEERDAYGDPIEQRRKTTTTEYVR